MCFIIPKYENILQGVRIIQKILSEERSDVACSPQEDEEWIWEGKGGVMNRPRNVTDISSDISKFSTYQECLFKETIWKFGLQQILISRHIHLFCTTLFKRK